MDVEATTGSAVERPTVVVFASLGDLAAAPHHQECQLPRHAVEMLCDWGVRLILVSAFRAEYVRQVQRELHIIEPFVCDRGAGLHVPSSYRCAGESPDAESEWEIFRFNPPDKAAAVTMVRDLFRGLGSDNVLTIGIGRDLDDYGVLAAVEIPIVVRDLVKDQSGLLRYVPAAYLTDATGADGWAEALLGP